METAEAAWRSTAQNIESMNDRYNGHQAKLSQLQQNVNSLMERKLQLNDNLQQRGNLLERKTSLESDIDQARLDVETWKQQLEPKVTKHHEAREAYGDAQKRRNVLVDEARTKVNYKRNTYSNSKPQVTLVLCRWKNCSVSFDS